LPEEIEPGDQELGTLLHSLGLMDADTLTALLGEARSQRRSLRQLLLAGKYLTLYQVAFIEQGNLDALVLGPVRVIDKLRSTPHEAVYRVFDPRRNTEAVLRHLAEEEMHDAVHPDEFRQRFAAAAAVRHPNLAAVLEVLEIADRPAVLVEWLSGLSSSDWPASAAAPGIWFRLVSQAALAVQTIHAAGLCHGHLGPGSFVLTESGVLKLCGLGKPGWLIVAEEASDSGKGPANEVESVAGDLAALARLAVSWSELVGPGRGKGKMPAELQAVLERLQSEQPEQRYASASELLNDLERASSQVPSSGNAWEKLLRQVSEHGKSSDQGKTAGLRQSA
jgi:hypothetical protein